MLDHFHLVLLSNSMLTDVRQRVAHEQHDRQGRKADPAWAHRRLLLRAGDQLGPRALASLAAVFATDDPTNQVGAAWAIKELLRQLLAGNGPSRYCRADASHRRTAFLAACVGADMPETTRLAATIERWWPEIEGFLQLGVTNARTEGYNRVIKAIKRVACGFRNKANYERRIMLHSATQRPRDHQQSRGTPRSSAKRHLSRIIGCGLPPIRPLPFRSRVGCGRTSSSSPTCTPRP